MFLMTRSAKKKQRRPRRCATRCSPAPASAPSGACTPSSRRSVTTRSCSRSRRACTPSSRRTPSVPFSTDEEFDRIVHGTDAEELDVDAVVPDDASALTARRGSADGKLDLGKKDTAADGRPTTKPTRTPRPPWTRRRAQGGHGQGRHRRLEGCQAGRRRRLQVGRRRRTVAAPPDRRSGETGSGGVARPHTTSWPLRRSRTRAARAVGQGETRRWQHRRRAEGSRAPRVGRGAPWR